MVNEKIPFEWEKDSLEDVCDFLDGLRKPVKKSDRAKMRGNIPYYGASGVIDWVNDFIFNEPLICVGEDGENLRSRVLPMAFKIDGKTWVNNHAHVLRPKENADIDYLTYYLNSIDYEQYITGSVQPKLNQNICRKISVLRPPIPEQRKIAAILTSVDDTIVTTRCVIDQTEVVKRGLMQQLLMKGIGHVDFNQTEIGEIPKKWSVVRISDIGRVVRGASPRPKGDPRYYGGDVPRLMVADITRDKKYITPKIDFLTKEGATKSRFMEQGTLVVACSGTIVGMPGILATDACIHDGILAVVDLKSTCETEYLYYVFISLFNQLNNRATDGGVLVNLTTDILRDTVFALPPLAEQIEIVKILCAVEEKVQTETSRLTELIRLKQGLMQVLLTGKVRVNVDEPSEVTTV